MRTMTVVALAATLLVVAGMARGATPDVAGTDVTQTTPEVIIDRGVIQGTDAATTAAGTNGSYTVGNSQSLIGNVPVDGALSVTAGKGGADAAGAVGGKGGNAALNIQAGGVFSASGGGGPGLMLTAGGGADSAGTAAAGAGGDAVFNNAGTATFGNGGSLKLAGGSKGSIGGANAGAAGKVTVNNTASMTFAAGSSFVYTPADSTIAFDNSGTLTVNQGITGFADLIYCSRLEFVIFLIDNEGVECSNEVGILLATGDPHAYRSPNPGTSY